MTWTYISELDAFTIYHKIQEQSSSSPDTFSLQYAFRNALSGAAGTAVSNLVVYPLDLVCTRLQVQSKASSSSKSSSVSKDGQSTTYNGILDATRKIYTNEGGIPAFYNGVASDTAKSVIDSFVFFFAYNLLWRAKKRNLPTMTHPLLQAVDGLVVGFLAGAFTKALTTPIQNVVTKQQTQRAADEQSAMDIARDIYARKGLAGFWTGYDASLILTFNPALTFFLDAALRKVLRIGEGADANPAATFVLAANGKATANVLTYPFKVAKGRAQVDASGEEEETAMGPSDKKAAEGASKAKGPVAAVRKIARTEGVGALYAGVGGELLRGFFSHGITMLVKEQIPILVEEQIPNVMLRFYMLYASLLRRRRNMKS